ALVRPHVGLAPEPIRIVPMAPWILEVAPGARIVSRRVLPLRLAGELLAGPRAGAEGTVGRRSCRAILRAGDRSKPTVDLLDHALDVAVVAAIDDHACVVVIRAAEARPVVTVNIQEPRVLRGGDLELVDVERLERDLTGH